MKRPDGNHSHPKTALVLSAGGMFAAYQAGVWKGLAGLFQPDIVVGASAGSLNAWAIAGGASPDELCREWLRPECSQFARFRFDAPWRGPLDARPLYQRIQTLCETYRPRTEIGIVAVELPRLKTRLFRNSEVTWRHLAASCAVLCGYPQVRISGRFHTDGGLLQALPIWAAAEMGATRVVAINALPNMPSRIVRSAVSVFRAVAPSAPKPPASLEVLTIAPSAPLGNIREAVFWNARAVKRWIARGEADAARLCPAEP